MNKKLIDSLIWGTGFIIAGIALLLNSLGIVDINVFEWWPIIFVVIGISIIADGLISKQ